MNESRKELGRNARMKSSNELGNRYARKVGGR